MTSSIHIVPEQKTGGHTGVTSKQVTGTRHEALQLFNDCKTRLLDINHWKNLCDNKGAEFWLTDDKGNLIHEKKPEVGNLIRIKLPAPPNKTGDGFDWVCIETFEENKDLVKDEEVFGFRTRPVQNPADKNGKSAHFYETDATSTFLLIRNNTSVTALERGRNEVPNHSGSLIKKLRNLLVALPAMFGFSKPQWKMLVNGILNPPKTYRHDTIRK